MTGVVRSVLEADISKLVVDDVLLELGRQRPLIPGVHCSCAHTHTCQHIQVHKVQDTDTYTRHTRHT